MSFTAVHAAVGVTTPQSDPSAIAWASQAMAALTAGVQVHAVNLQANVIRSIAGNQQTGTMTLQSSGVSNGQVSITIGSTTPSVSRSLGANGPTGQWVDASGTTYQMAQHNCWTDAAGFFPALSMLSGYSDPSLVFSDLGQETRRGRTVEHFASDLMRY